MSPDTITDTFPVLSVSLTEATRIGEFEPAQYRVKLGFSTIAFSVDLRAQGKPRKTAEVLAETVERINEALSQRTGHWALSIQAPASSRCGRATAKALASVRIVAADQALRIEADTLGGGE